MALAVLRRAAALAGRQPGPARAARLAPAAALLAAAGVGAVAQQARGLAELQSVKARSGLTAPLLQLEDPVRLYQYASCPFCNKAQAFMEFHGIPYEKIEVNPLSKEQIKFSKDYRMVPIAVINGKQVNGSGVIIDTLMGANEKSADESKWCSWVDDHLVHLLPPNIYRTPGEAIQAFDYITTNSGDFSLAQQYAIRYSGAVIMYFIAKRAKKKYNLSDNARQDLFDALDTWAGVGLGGAKFHGGDRPDTADLAVFGVLRSIDGNYQTWDDLCAHKLAHNEAFWSWYLSVKEAVAFNRADPVPRGAPAH